MNLTNIYRVKQYMKFGFTNIDDDHIFNQLVQSVSKMIENSPLFDRYAEKVERTETFDTEYGQEIFPLRGVPVDTALTFKVWHDIARDYGDTALLDADNYYIEGATGILKVDNFTVAKGKGSLRVQYTGGLSPHTDRLTGTIETVSGTFTSGEFVGGSLSGARGKLVGSITTGDTAITIVVINGIFEANETITGETSAKTCKLKTITQTPLVMSYPDLAMACDMQCAFQFQRKTEVGLRSVSVEGGSINTYEPTEFLPEVRRVLSSYRRIGSIG